MEVADYLTTIGVVSAALPRVRNLHLLFGESIKKARMNLNGTYRVIC